MQKVKFKCIECGCFVLVEATYTKQETEMTHIRDGLFTRGVDLGSPSTHTEGYFCGKCGLKIATIEGYAIDWLRKNNMLEEVD